jgi:hypothetical protein
MKIGWMVRLSKLTESSSSGITAVMPSLSKGHN